MGYNPVHMEPTQPVRARVTPKDFFLWLGAMAFFYVSVFAFISLIFSYLDFVFPDALQYYSGDPYSGGVSYEMASIIVLFPLFLVLMRVIHRTIETDATRADVWVRRWALYLTLFLAGITVAADLITLVMYFFNGDVTLRFGLKVLAILLVAGAGFLHFLADLRGYWERNPGSARLISWGSVVVVIATIVAGFFIIGTPWQARQYRYDEQRVSDLQNIQYQVVAHWQQKQVLPASLNDLTDSISGYTAPHDPVTGTSYTYETTGAKSFELCAEFSAPNRPGALSRDMVTYPVPGSTGGYPNEDVWTHGAGHVCFSRTIDPQRYPPLTKPLY
jgi:hypothetical protein